MSETITREDFDAVAAQVLQNPRAQSAGELIDGLDKTAHGKKFLNAKLVDFLAIVTIRDLLELAEASA